MKRILLAAVICLNSVWAQFKIEQTPKDQKNSNINVSAVAGLNWATKSAVREGDTFSSYSNFAIGLQAWYKSIFEINVGRFAASFQPGLYAGLTPIYRYTDSSSSRKSSDTKFPLIAEVRLLHSSGFFAGLGGGWAWTVITNNDVTEASGSAAVISILAGYQRTIWRGLLIGATLRTQYFMQQIESPNGARTANNNVNFMPAISVGYGF